MLRPQAISALVRLVILVLCYFTFPVGISAETDALRSNNKSSFPDNKSTLIPGNFNFIENRGQLKDAFGKSASAVKFYIELPGVSVFFTDKSVIYDFLNYRLPNNAKNLDKTRFDRKNNNAAAPDENGLEVISHYRIDMEFLGLQSKHSVKGVTENGGVNNYYSGNEHVGGVKLYSKITYENLYPGIDLIFYNKPTGEGIKYDFVVRPGADPSKIHYRYVGNDSLKMESDGSMVLKTPFGTITEEAPLSYQETIAPDNIVRSSFIKHGHEISFKLGPYNESLPLIIDPSILVWSTYYGGNGTTEEGTHMVTDGNGDLIVSGRTNSSNFPTTVGVSQATSGGTQDGFILKFSNTGTRIWGTYFGGSLTDTPRSCGVDANGNVFVIGITQSLNMPLMNPGGGAFYQSTNLACIVNPVNVTAFIVKLTASGNLTWSTYLGGNVGESGVDLWIDSGNNLLITGCTASANFPVTAGAFQATYSGPLAISGVFGDVFIAKFSNAGVLTWSTLYGGTQDEIGYGITTDNSDNIYVCGWTVSTNFPVSAGAFQTSFGGGTGDAFVLKFSPTGTRLWATYFGGSGTQRTLDCVFSNAYLYFSGYTVGSLPGSSTGVFQPANAGGAADGYIVKLEPNASDAAQVIWRTFVGGSGDDGLDELTKDNAGNIVSGGYTNSTNYPASANAYQTVLGGDYDGHVITLDQDAQLICATYFGRINKDNVYGLAIASNNDVFITGNTANTQADGFEISAGAFQTVKGAGLDAYLARLTDITLPPVSAFAVNPSSGCAPLIVTATNNSVSNNTCLSTTTYLWSFPGGIPVSSVLQTPPPVSYAIAGTYTITLLVTNAFGSNSSTQTVIVNASNADWDIQPTICSNAPVINLSTLVTGSPGGTFTGNGVTGNTFNPAGLTGTIQITYTVGSGACQSQEQHTIDVIDLPLPQITGPVNYCINDVVSPLTAGNAGVAQVNWYSDQALTTLVFTGTSFTPPAQTANYYVVYSINGCNSAATTVTITFLNNPNPGWSIPPTICSSAASIDLSTLVTGTSGGTFSGNGVTGNLFNPTGLNQTVSIVYTVGSGACSAAETHTIQVVDVPVPQITGPTTYCSGEPIVPLTVSNPGQATVNWFSDASLQTLVFTGSTFSPPSTDAIYYVTQTLNGCTSTSTELELTFSNPAIPTGIAELNYCEGATLPIASFTSTSGLVAWFSDSQLLNQLSTGNTYQIQAGQTQIWVASVLGNCISEPVLVTITVGAGIDPIIAGNVTICLGEGTTLTVQSPTGAGFIYQWQLGSATSGFSNIVDNAQFSGSTTSTLQLTGSTQDLNNLEFRCIVSGNCPNADTSNTLILAFTDGPKILSEPECPVTCNGIPPTISFSASGTNNDYQWEILENSGSFSALENSEYFSGVLTNSLTVTPTEELNGRIIRCRLTGCSGFIYTDTVLLRFSSNYPVFIPNAFTPDDDPTNRIFKIYTLGNPPFNATIFNRWGEEIYTWNTVDSGWDGTYSGKLAEDGMYVYRIRFTSPCDKNVITGSVMLIR